MNGNNSISDVTTPPEMPSVTFQKTGTQRRFRRRMGLRCTAIGVVLLVLGLSTGNVAGGLVLGGVLLVYGIVTLADGNPQTTIDTDGPRTSSLFRRNSCEWSEVRDITCKSSQAEDVSHSRIKISRKVGGSFSLPAPTNTSASANRNPDFQLEFATIRSYWENNS